MFDNLRQSIKDFSDSVASAVTERELTEDDIDDVLWDLELSLLQNNVAQEVVDRLKADLKEDLVGVSVTRTKVTKRINEALRDAIHDVLKDPGPSIDSFARENSAVVLFMGFNGSGKTTTLAKLSALLQDKGYDTLLAAGDTYRSAAIQQLEEHGNTLNTRVISHDYGADSAAVIYDAKEHAEKEGYDFVLADTAGRSHDDANLMDELAKICDVNDPDLRLLVVDALAGNDVVNQAEQYMEIGFDGIVVTKMDVDQNGGAILSLGYLTGKPIMYVGTGQGYDDIERFDPDSIVDRLLVS